MPTNLPPDYFNAEKRFREAQTPAEKIALLEEMISIVPKHKGTDHLRADLRRQLSRLKDESQAAKKHAGHSSIYHVEKEGAGQVAVIGPTNTGKSALVAALTNAEPEISPAPFTTRRPLPGMMPWEDIQVQLVDTPAMEQEYTEAGLYELVRHADVMLLMVDLQADPLQQLDATIDLLAEHRIIPQHLQQKFSEESKFTAIPQIVLVNKCDDESMDDLFSLCCELLEGEIPMLPVSAITWRNLGRMKSMLYPLLQVIRVYAKPHGREPDMQRPFVLKKGSTVNELARKVHRDFYEHLKTARVWGSAAFDGQMVQRDYVLQDRDIVELRV
jgi:hypothetical protein